MEKLRLLSTGLPECDSNTCPYQRECANHATAGDFRMEGGLTPNLFADAYGDVFCNQNVKNEDFGDGILLYEKGEFRTEYH